MSGYDEKQTIMLPKTKTIIEEEKLRDNVKNIKYIKNLEETKHVDSLKNILLNINQSKLKKKRPGKIGDTYSLEQIQKIARDISVLTTINNKQKDKQTLIDEINEILKKEGILKI